MARRIVQIATYPMVGSTSVYALCNDGTLWALHGRKDWTRLKDVPQDGPASDGQEIDWKEAREQNAFAGFKDDDEP